MGVGSWDKGFLGGMMSPYMDLYWSERALGGNFTEMVVDANSVLLIRKN